MQYDLGHEKQEDVAGENHFGYAMTFTAPMYPFSPLDLSDHAHVK